MFDDVEIVINDKSISGFPAFVILLCPVVALILLGVIIGAQL